MLFSSPARTPPYSFGEGGIAGPKRFEMAKYKTPYPGQMTPALCHTLTAWGRGEYRLPCWVT